MGYEDSSNAYTAFAGDPVNNFDPRGEWVGVDNVVAGVASVAIGFAATCVFDDCSDYSWKDGAVDFGLGFATTGLSSINRIQKLGRAARWGTRVGLEAGLDVAGEATRRRLNNETLGNDYTLEDLAGGAVRNALFGEGGALVARRARRFFADPYYYAGRWQRPGRFASGPPPTAGSVVRGLSVRSAIRVKKRITNALEGLGVGRRYHRPKLLAQTRRDILGSAPRTPDGRFLDPNTRLPINGEFDIGHRPGYEHRRLMLEARKRRMNQRQFSEWVNRHPEWFQVEDRRINRSHRYELPGSE